LTSLLEAQYTAGQAVDSVHSLTGQQDSMGWARYGVELKMLSWMGRMASILIDIVHDDTTQLLH